MHDDTHQTKQDISNIKEIASQRIYELKEGRREGTLTVGLIYFGIHICSLKVIKGTASAALVLL